MALKNKFIVILISLIYSYIFYIGYIDFLHPYFDYAGFHIINDRIDNILLISVTYLFVILPLFFYNGFNKISSFLCIFIYYLLYVPILFNFFFNMVGDVSYVIYMQFQFLVGMCILFSADYFQFKKRLILPFHVDIFKIMLSICILLTLYILFIYRSNLEFVSFTDVYDHRSKNVELGDDIVTNYLSVWLHNAIIPICLSYSFFSRKKIYFIIGSISCVIIYMATAAKSVLLFPILFYVIYLALKSRPLKSAFNTIGLGLISVMILTLYIGFNDFSSLLWMRTIGNGGYLTKYYHDFFLTNPLTYYSHINVVNAITGVYPYEKTLGEIIGHHYWNDADTNANFWATDGIAALGSGGIVFSSILLFFLFILFNTISKRYNSLFLILILIPYSLALLNASLFSSMITGGGFIIFIFLSLSNTVSNNFINNYENSNVM